MVPIKSERVEFRAPEGDVAAWRDAAEQAEMTLSDWIRRTLNAAARKGRR